MAGTMTRALGALLGNSAPAPDTAGPPMPSKMPTAGEIRQFWLDGQNELVDTRRNYWLNKAFFLGNQSVRWSPQDNTIVPINFTSTADADTRRRINLFRNRTNRLHSRLVQQDLEFEVEPPNAEQASLRRQSIQEHVLEAQRQRGWENIRSTNMQSTLFGGTAAIVLEWDDSAKGLLVKVNDPVDGKQQWIGGVKLSSLNIAEFCLEPGSREARDSLWAIRATTLTTKQAQRRFNLPKEPRPDAQAMSLPSVTRFSRTSTVRPETKVCMVYTYYQRPMNGEPGCIIHAVGDYVEPHPWPYGFDDRLPFYLGRQTQIDDTWVGDTLLSDARSVQIAYNDARTCASRYVRRAANARVMYPAGTVSDDDQLTDDVGETFEYEPSPNGAKPEWFAAPEMPRWLQNEPLNCTGELDELFNEHAVSRGQQVGDRNSGLALSILAEKDNTPLGTMAREQSDMWGQVGAGVLATIRTHLPPGSTVTTSVKDRNGVTVQKEWTKEDLDEQPTVRVPLDATSPKNLAAVRDEFTKVATAFPMVAQSMTLDSLGRVLDMPSVDDAFGALNTDRTKALRENESMAKGNFETPDTWDEHPVHIVEHNRFRNSTEYESLPPALQDQIDAHVDAHETMARDDVAAQNPMPPDNGLGGPPPPDAGPGAAPPPGADMTAPPPGGELPQPPQPIPGMPSPSDQIAPSPFPA